ncbi:MAG: lysine exporter LysO family protein [Muribaculaceae bacterium]|nr:lysine exporter LysO family protein [Muribaculaceae bacterium]MDE6754913.1 lysine exporter LysO family protein [Muribaculaceae bacterium]
MKGSLLIVLVFSLGIALGYSGVIPSELNLSSLSMPVLYILIAIIGFEFGHKNLVPTLSRLTKKAILVPFLTVGGTLAFTFIAWAILQNYSLSEYLAMGSGLGYYSLAPLLIIDFKKEVIGMELATRLATITLMANMVREILSLTCAPVFKRVFGWYAPICASGVASIDVVLPVIVRTCGQEALPYAIVQGVMLEIGVPSLVFLFCSV